MYIVHVIIYLKFKKKRNELRVLWMTFMRITLVMI